jgi:hypothetical protein
MNTILSPLKFFLTILFFCLHNTAAIAWSGVDYENQTSIDIGSGNLVREGNIIDFYQQKTNELLSGKVISINYFGNATELIIEELNTTKKRTIMMQN